MDAVVVGIRIHEWEDISNAWLPYTALVSDLWGLRARMIKLLNLPWNPPATVEGDKVKERKRGRAK